MTIRHSALAALAALALITGCDDKTSSPSVTVTPLDEGDSRCPHGGVLLAVGSSSSPVCNGAPGEPGDPGTTGLPGPQGATGPQGPIGGGRYVTRDDVYCDSAVGADASAGAASVRAECRTLRDLPLSGSCAQNNRTDVRLAQAEPRFWDGATNTLRPAFLCSWGDTDGVLVPMSALPTATATICCVAVPEE